jgi:hypothetical protein
MSNSNLHTCDKAAPGWQREGPCAECQHLSDSNARLSKMFRERVPVAPPKITAFMCPSRGCDHVMDGPVIDLEEGRISTATCSKCGATAFSLAMWE